ncbi:glycosyltransferase, family 8 [Helicobacter pullorum MIT 98-5489]|uniref:Glycosyltransferase, family 8 n=2 Tax=Helicobacter pullorum TaxID=35818 RepID=C5EZG9_9HELI|nr:glycosyltransferase family 8 protein [Helicobacter pullorum]EEQ63284.1 glycosyltransferase, family 8 [Helicobacter pullorum MIT 98-5489]
MLRGGGGAYNFHLLMDFVSQETKEKLQNLILELSKIYPCTLNIHILEDEIFRTQSLRTLNGNYLAYYRLRIGSALPLSIKRCVYLDVDMIVLGDLRELFKINLQGKICGVVMEGKDNDTQNILESKNKINKSIAIVSNYFNSGMLLVDLDLWRKENIEDRAFEIVKKYYCHKHDEHILNAVLQGQTFKILPQWNMMVFLYCRAVCLNERGKINMPYNRKDFNNALKNPKILHYHTHHKPWEDSKIYLNYCNKFLGQYWWDMVEQTPIFKEKLLQLKPQADSALAFQCLVGYKLLRYYQKGLFILIPFYTYFLIKNKDSIEQEEIPLKDYNLAREIGRAAFNAYHKRKKGKLISFPFRMLHIIKNFRKNQARILG